MHLLSLVNENFRVAGAALFLETLSMTMTVFFSNTRYITIYIYGTLTDRVAGAALLGWSRSRPEPSFEAGARAARSRPFTLEPELFFWSGSGSYSYFYSHDCKYFIFRDPKYDYDYDYDYDYAMLFQTDPAKNAHTAF